MELESRTDPVIKVLGVGGAGGYFINSMMETNLKKFEFVAINTDVKELSRCNASEKIQIGETLVNGSGADTNPQVGYHSAHEDQDKLKAIVKDADMVFITAGLGGGTGTGASPVIAELARNAGALTVAVVTRPFDFEGKIRSYQAEDGIKGLKNYVDALIVIPNQKLIDTIEKNTPIAEAFNIGNDAICQAVKSITDLITNTGYIVVDLNDVKTILIDAGKVLMGVGIGSGENRAKIATEKAISNLCLEELSMKGAKGILVNISGSSSDLGLLEVSEVMSIIHDMVDTDANVIWGMVLDDNLDKDIKVTFLVTGLDVAR
jgi:cell division protein FtsZ